MLTYKNRVPLMRLGPSVVWHISLPLMNSFKKNPRLLFSHAGYASWGLSLSSVYFYNIKSEKTHL